MVDMDKSVWFQGRAAWLFATLHHTVERRPEWLAAARSCLEFSRRHCHAPDGSVLDHHDGRTLNPGHAFECAWFALCEGDLRRDQMLIQLGCMILDWMWGFPAVFGGIRTGAAGVCRR